MDSKKFTKEPMLGVSAKNKSTQLQSDFFEMLVCKNQENQPFLNVFQAAGNNFEEKKLGKIFGIIQVLDFSESSEYLPNLLSQVIKKEFYRYPREGTEQCFENALHKANLALADLARHDIIQWIGKIDAIVGIISENNVLLSQAGDGKAFLVREKNFLEITQPTDDEEKEIHPVKTFSEILSGKIEPEDKLIFTTKEVFRSLKREELKRHSKVFNPHEFDNLVRSSLELEANNIGMIIVNISEKEIYQYEEPEDKALSEEVNFFGSQPAKSKKEDRKETPVKKVPAPVEKPEIVEEEEKEDSLSYNSEFYIKEELEEENPDSRKISEKINAAKIFDTAKKGCVNCYEKTSDYVRNIDYSKIKKIKVKRAHRDKIKNFFKRIWAFVPTVKDKIGVWLIILKKKRHARKEEKERKKRLDQV